MGEREMFVAAMLPLLATTGHIDIATRIAEQAADSNDLSYRMFKAGLEAGRRTTPDRDAWISVDDRLPEEGQDVSFVVKAAKGSIQDYLNGRVLGGRFMIVFGHPTFTVPGVGFNASHWMPLPTAPTAASREEGNV
ncbi:DUF551 domain-containing protein [Burkholderia territorii]|uniref:DUF551 domain-containing protein n=1 Tax=Burkholderia territorii TaxID=1503055 RepID=UPI00075A8143|nr:DUF551 domain-containing protein [Burkholderia territorii]KWO62597.1 hypothetical protein WT98_30490 [Burkholderia territorii]